MSTACTKLTEEDVAKAAVAVAKAFGVSTEDLRGSRRHAPTAEARFAFHFLLHEETGASSTAIGALLGRSYSTVLWGAVRARELASAYPRYATRLSEAREAFTGRPVPTVATTARKAWPWL